jgi:hypothetical protein
VLGTGRQEIQNRTEGEELKRLGDLGLGLREFGRQRLEAWGQRLREKGWKGWGLGDKGFGRRYGGAGTQNRSLP